MPASLEAESEVCNVQGVQHHLRPRARTRVGDKDGRGCRDTQSQRSLPPSLFLSISSSRRLDRAEFRCRPHKSTNKRRLKKAPRIFGPRLPGVRPRRCLPSGRRVQEWTDQAIDDGADRYQINIDKDVTGGHRSVDRLPPDGPIIGTPI